METLQRIYGISFPDNKMMKTWEKFQEEARNRDHRKIGKVPACPGPQQDGDFLCWPLIKLFGVSSSLVLSSVLASTLS